MLKLTSPSVTAPAYPPLRAIVVAQWVQRTGAKSPWTPNRVRPLIGILTRNWPLHINSNLMLFFIGMLSVFTRKWPLHISIQLRLGLHTWYHVIFTFTFPHVMIFSSLQMAMLYGHLSHSNLQYRNNIVNTLQWRHDERDGVSNHHSGKKPHHRTY